MEGYRTKPRRDTVHREVWGYKTEVKERIEMRERLALRNKVKEEEHLEIYGRLREEIGTKTYLYRPMEICENAETVISCRGPGPTRKKTEVC